MAGEAACHLGEGYEKKSRAILRSGIPYVAGVCVGLVCASPYPMMLAGSSRQLYWLAMASPYAPALLNTMMSLRCVRGMR